MPEKMQIPHTFSLPNGLLVVYIHKPDAASFSVCITGRVGSMIEQEGEAGAAHFLEHVLFDGSEKYPDEEEFESLIEDIGGHRNGATGNEYVKYYVKVLSKHADRAFEYLSELVIHPLIAERSVTKQRGIIIEEINMYRSDPGSVAGEALMELFYPATRLGGLITGTVADVEELKIDTLRQYHRDHYNASNFVLGICGSLELSEVKNLATKYFSALPIGLPIDLPHFSEQCDFALANISRQEIEQAHLWIGYYAPHLDDDKSFAWTALSRAFAAGQLSRLYQMVREKHSLAYTVSSYNDPSPHYGTFGVYAGLTEKNIPKYLDLYQQIVNGLQSDLISEREYERVIDNLVAGFLFSSENTSSVASHYAYNKLFDPNILTYANYVEKFRAVTREDIRQAALEVFAQKPKVVVVGRNVAEGVFDPLRS
jgi:predicted Zn-dependent peptidase